MNLLELRTLDLADAQEWPLRLQQALLAVAAAIVLLLGWQFWLSGLWEEYRVGVQALQERAAELERETQHVNRLRTLEGQRAELDRIGAEVDLALPAAGELPALLTSLESAAQHQGAQLLQFKPGGELAPAAGVVALPVQVRVLGDYRAIQRLVAEVAGLPRLLTLRAVQFQQEPSGPRLAADFDSRAYRADASAAPIERDTVPVPPRRAPVELSMDATPPPEPAAPVRLQSSREPNGPRSPVAAVFGTLSRGDHREAMVELDDGQTVHLAAGDVFGRSPWVVETVGENFLRIRPRAGGSALTIELTGRPAGEGSR